MESIIEVAMVRLTQDNLSDHNQCPVDSSHLDCTIGKLISLATLRGCLVESAYNTAEVSLMFRDVWGNYISSAPLSPKHMRLERQALLRLVKNEAKDYLDKIICFCRSFRIELSERDTQVCLDSLVLCSAFGILHANFKYLINEIFIEADHCQTEMPSKPKFLVRGIFPRTMHLALKRAVLNSRTKNGKRSSDCLIYSLFQGLKKGLLPIRPEHIDTSLKKHCAALTKRPCPLSGEFSEFALKQLQKEFCSLIVPEELSYRRPVVGTISNKSTIEQTRSKGGQVGLATQCYLSHQAELVRVDLFLGYSQQDLRVYRDQVLYERTISLKPEYGIISDDEIIQTLKEMREQGDVSIHHVRPAVILEPLKGRIITKPGSGDYLEYTNIQSFLWNKLKKFKSFELIGRPVTIEDIWYVCGNMKASEFLNSGDYSGATDNLSSELSELIVRFLFQEWSFDDISWLIDSFCHARVDYTQKPLRDCDSEWMQHFIAFKSTEQGTVVQQNGQLMGHVLSFPILCLANYLIFKYTFYKARLPTPSVLINGDDILFKCPNRQVFNLWESLVRSVGFEPSMGKNLTSATLCQINSVLFRIVYYDDCLLDGFRPVIRDIRAIPYLNFGILTGRGKGREMVDLGRSDLKIDTLYDELTSLHSNLRLVGSYWNGTWDSEYTKEYYFNARRGFFNKLRDKKVLSLPQSYKFENLAEEFYADVCKDARVSGCFNSFNNYFKGIPDQKPTDDFVEAFRQQRKRWKSNPFCVLYKNWDFTFETEELTRTDRL